MRLTAGGLQATVKMPRATLMATKTSKLSISPEMNVEPDQRRHAIPSSYTRLVLSVILPMKIPNKAVGPSTARPERKL